MTEPLQVGQFAIVDHEPVDRGPNAGVFHGRGPADDRAELYIVAEGTTPAGEAFAGHVVSAVGQAWGSFDISLTGSLRRTFAEAERYLLDWNARSIAQHRVSLGMSAFARRGAQAVIAQAGPSIAFHLSDGEIQSYTAEGDHAEPIGAKRGIEPQLTRIPFKPGDRVLLLSTAAAGALDDELISGILALPAPNILPELYDRLKQLRNLTVLLITSQAVARPASRQAPVAEPEESQYVIGADEPFAGDDAAAAPPEDSIYQPSLFIDDEDAEVAVEYARRQIEAVAPREPIQVSVPVLAQEYLEPLRRAAGDDSLMRLAAERRASANAARALNESNFVISVPAAATPGRPAWRTPAAPGPDLTPEPRRRHIRRESFTRGLTPPEVTPIVPPIEYEAAPLVHEMAAEERTRAQNAYGGTVSETIAGENAATIAGGGSLVRVRSNMGGRWKASNGGARVTATGGQNPPTWVVVLAGISILLAVVGYLVVPQLLEQDNNARYASLIQDAQKELTTAQVQQDPAQRRAAYTEAHALLLEARDLPQAGPEAEQLLAEVAAALEAMDAIRTPASVQTVARLEQFGERPVAAAQIAVSATHAFILDSASPQVISVSLANGEAKSLFAENKDARRGRPIAIAYTEVAEAGGPALVIADSNRTLFEYLADGTLKTVPFAAPPNLNITDMTIYRRELYILDAPGNAVYRWAPADGGFGAAPAKVLSSPELAQARRLMVDDEIVTSDDDGTVRRFTGQYALTLSTSGIDKKLVSAEPPQALTPNGDIGVLDPANDRIVVLRRDGTFDRQYRHKDFQGASAFAVVKGVPYVFANGQLRRVTW